MLVRVLLRLLFGLDLAARPVDRRGFVGVVAPDEKLDEMVDAIEAEVKVGIADELLCCTRLGRDCGRKAVLLVVNPCVMRLGLVGVETAGLGSCRVRRLALCEISDDLGWFFKIEDA